MSDGTGCDNMTCIIVKLKPQLKRPHYDVEEDDMSDGAEPKKPKSDSTWREYDLINVTYSWRHTCCLYLFLKCTDTCDWFMDIIFFI